MAIELASAAPPRPRLEVAGVMRAGPPGRDFVSPTLRPDLSTAPTGVEVAFTWLRRRSKLGWKVAMGLEGWTRRWVGSIDDLRWGGEVGIRMEPRVSARFVFARRGLWDYRWSVVPTLDVGVGAAVSFFVDDVAGWWAASPTLAVRPGLHLGKKSPWFVAADLRGGIHRRITACLPSRDGCPETRVNAGGTSLGLVVGGTFR